MEMKFFYFCKLVRVLVLGFFLFLCFPIFGEVFKVMESRVYCQEAVLVNVLCLLVIRCFCSTVHVGRNVLREFFIGKCIDFSLSLFCFSTFL